MKTLVLGLLFACSAFCIKADVLQDNPYTLIEDLANTTFSRMNAEWRAQKDNPDVLRKIIREELLPHMDYRFAAFKVLGNNYKRVPKDKLQRYVDSFKEYLVASYAVALGYYDDQRVTFEPARNVANKSTVVVRGRIQGGQGPDINIAFKVRKNKKDLRWRAYDLVAEGISLIDSKRSEFAPVLRSKGIDGVMATMNRTTASQQNTAS